MSPPVPGTPEFEPANAAPGAGLPPPHGRHGEREWAWAMGALILAAAFLFVITRRAPYFFLGDDNAVQMLPWYSLNCRSLAQTGELAVYNWFQYLGQPHLGGGQTGVLYPPVYMAGFLAHYVFADFRMIIDVLVWMHLLGGTLGMFFLLRQHAVDPRLSLFGAVLAATLPFVIFLSCIWVSVAYAFCWLPWQFYAVDRLRREPSLANAFLCAFVRAIFLLQGNVQWVVYASLGEALWLSVTFLVARTVRGRFLAAWMVSFLVAGIFALPLLWEMAQIADESPRGDALSATMRLTFPIDVGDFLAAQVGNFGAGAFSMDTRMAFLGWIAIALVVSLRVGAKATGQMTAAFGLLGVTLMAAWGWLPWLYDLPVLDHFRWPFKWLLFAGFAAVLGLATTLAAARSQRLLGGLSATILLVFAVGLNLAVILSGTPESHLRRKRVLAVDPMLLEATSQSGRVLSLRPPPANDLTGPFCFNYPTWIDRFSIGGYDPAVPRRNAAATVGIGINNFVVVPLNRPWLDRFASLSGRYLLAPSESEADLLRDPTLELREAARTSQGTLFINDRARPLAALVDGAGQVTGLPVRVEGSRLVTTLNGGLGALVLMFIPGNRLEFRFDTGLWQPVDIARDVIVVPAQPLARRLEIRYLPDLFLSNCAISGLTMLLALVVILRERRLKQRSGGLAGREGPAADQHD